MLQRGLFCAAAAVMVCAIGVAVLQLAVLFLAMSSPVAITVTTLVAVVLAQFAAPSHTPDRQAPIRPQKSAQYTPRHR